MEGGSGAGSAAQPADLDWEASEVTAPRGGCARPAGAGAALPAAHPQRSAPRGRRPAQVSLRRARGRSRERLGRFPPFRACL